MYLLCGSSTKPGLSPDTLGGLSGSTERRPGACLVKKYKFVERQRRTGIRQEHWPEQLYYCQRFTLHFIPPLSLVKLKERRSEGVDDIGARPCVIIEMKQEISRTAWQRWHTDAQCTDVE